MVMISSPAIEYHNGKKVKKIGENHLRSIRSRVRTHEGEFLHGAKGRAYMNKYSEKYLGKNLAGTYNDKKVRFHGQ